MEKVQGLNQILIYSYAVLHEIEPKKWITNIVYSGDLTKAASYRWPTMLEDAWWKSRRAAKASAGTQVQSSCLKRIQMRSERNKSWTNKATKMFGRLVSKRKCLGDDSTARAESPPSLINPQWQDHMVWDGNFDSCGKNSILMTNFNGSIAHVGTK